MKRTIVVLLLTFSLAACAGMTPAGECEGQSSPPVKIHYGDSQISVTPRVAVAHLRGNFVLRLQPNRQNNDPVNYEEVAVTVKGKSGAAWITEKTATFAKDEMIVYCVPGDVDTMVYSYEVTVDSVGNLDPRVDVRR